MGNKGSSETAPMLPKEQKPCCNCKNLFYIFYFLCSLSGQYSFFSVKKCSYQMVLSIIGCICFFGHSIIYIVYAGVTVTVEVTRIGNLSEVINSTDNDLILCALPQEHWKFTTAIFFSAFSAFFSYLIVTVFILIPSNWMVCCCCCKHCREHDKNSDGTGNTNSSVNQQGSTSDSDENCCSPNSDCCFMYRYALKDDTLSPFSDDDSSQLLCKDGCWFFANYVLIMFFLLCCGISTSVAYIIFVYHQSYCWFNAVGITMTVLHLITQFCAIQSCFIFSKIVYIVINRLKKLEDDICKAAKEMSANADHCEHQTSTNTPSCVVPCLLYKEKEDRKKYHKLREIDQEFIDKVKPTLDLFGYWFIFHWIAYAVTTMLLSAFIVQVIIDVIRYNVNSVNNMIPETVTDTKSPYVSYVVFFTLVHAYLFLYPCFRAAAIATARAELIAKISKQKWESVSVQVQTNFVQYLTSQNFAF